MGLFSLWHWLMVFVILLLLNLPAYWVLRKAGWNGWFFLLFGLPLINLIFLYVFAFAKWPVEEAADVSRGA